MKKVKFIFAIHNHQPVGNFENVAEDAYQSAYLPFVEAMKARPWFKFNLHYTGSLLKWLDAAHPEFIEVLREMVQAGQVEMMGGGFYEPILALLPDRDKEGQVRKLSSYLKKTFGREPSGMWLAERVWEPHLPKAIAGAGIDYVVVDDFHFKMSGLAEADLNGYYLTEEQGVVVKVFPGSEKLRYTIPFKEPDETLRTLAGVADGAAPVMVMADDGEKFGVWPGTHKWVYQDGWLARFMDALEANRDWLETTTFGEYASAEGPRGRVYLPTCSYMEMGEWSLPAPAMREYEAFVDELKRRPDYDSKRPFVKGGFFRNFLAKYPESNAMHKRMLHVSAKVQKAVEASGAGKKGREQREEMQDLLWQGQCNDAYWHGVFGGLYLPHLRDAVYRNLIGAEEIAERMLHGDADGPILMEQSDLDGDGSPEVMLSNGRLALIVDPAEGGSITELDYRPARMNLIDTLARREEAYHDKLSSAASGEGNPGGAKTIHELVSVKESGLTNFLHYDWYRRTSLIDHFLAGESDLDSFRRADCREAGDFVNGRYDLSTKKTRDGVRLTMSRLGRVSGLPIRVKKVVNFGAGDAAVGFDYTLRNESDEEINTVFGVEFNFSLLAGDAPDRYFEAPGHKLKERNFRSAGELNNVREFRMVDEWLNYAVDMTFGDGAVLWRFPVETVSQSEAGFERIYQGSAIMPHWHVSIEPGGSWNVGIRLGIARRKKQH